MYALFVTLYFVLGTIIGSFLNVVVLRYYLRSSLKGRSFCFSCGKHLRWYELIPILSYIMLRGHCLRCKSAISLQYPLVEFATGIVFAGIILTGYRGLALVISTISMALLMGILVYDARHKIVPDALVYSFIGISFLSLFIDSKTIALTLPTLAAFFAGPVLFVPFFAIWYFSKGAWMGLGDGKVSLGIGWSLGLAKGITAIMFSFWIALAVVGLLYLLQSLSHGRLPIIRKRLTRKTEIPFTPFLILGYMLVFFFEFNLVVFIL